MKIIKKFIGICEHDWRYGGSTLVGHSDESYDYNAMSFKIKLICSDCGKIATEKSKLFSKTDIASDYYFLKKKYYGDTLDDCIEKLKATQNASIVKKSFIIKLNKKYNLNLTIKDL